jgi:hypothetical protein
MNEQSIPLLEIIAPTHDISLLHDFWAVLTVTSLFTSESFLLK